VVSRVKRLLNFGDRTHHRRLNTADLLGHSGHLLGATKDIDISDSPNSCSADGAGAQLRCPSGTWGAAMSEQLYDFFGEIFQGYFRPTIDAYPRIGGALVKRLLTLTDDVSDRLAQTRCVAMAWAKAETPSARITSELFVITQHGLVYAAGLNDSRRALYYLATPPALFDPLVDQVDTAELREGAVVVVDSRLGRDLASAHPMDAALRRILEEHLALRVDLPA
jgi:hypothetical protein